jgi:hypothetical protein
MGAIALATAAGARPPADNIISLEPLEHTDEAIEPLGDSSFSCVRVVSCEK